MLIVGFQGMRDFYPSVVARHLSDQGHPARAVYLPGDLLTDRRDANTVQLAEALEQPKRSAALGQALRRVVAPGERIGLPALLGLDRHHEVWTQIQDLAAAPIFEIPTLPPSVPGIRLHRALVRLLGARGVRVEANMEVVEVLAAGDRMTSVATATSARPLRHRSAAYLLATGGILGGGIQTEASGRVWETVFDLSLTAAQARTQWLRGAFLDPAGHPIFQAGVPIGDDFRPVREGAPAYANVWAAGSILAHADPIRERSREGIAVATAHAAIRALLGQTVPAGTQPTTLRSQ
jgi:glycerol-3-phosphate dehydrogenase subunit B